MLPRMRFLRFPSALLTVRHWAEPARMEKNRHLVPRQPSASKLGLSDMERDQVKAPTPKRDWYDYTKLILQAIAVARHARKNVAGKVPRFSFIVIEASVSLNPCFFSRFARSI
jgi:hypothetical protein